MNKNFCIKCNVSNCKNNANGNYCSLDGITVTCDANCNCTRCASYCEKGHC